MLRNAALIGLLILTLALSACGNATNTLSPNTTSISTTNTAPANTSNAAQTSADSTPTAAAVSAGAVTATTGGSSVITVPIGSVPANLPTLPVVTGGSSVLTITIAPPPTFAPYNNPNLDFFYNYPNSKPLSVTEAAKNAFTASAAQAIQTESIKLELYTSSDDPAKIFKSFADAAQAKGFKVAKQDDKVVAVINDQTREIGQATLIPVANAVQILGITPDAANNGIIYAVITGKLAPKPSPVAQSPSTSTTTTSITTSGTTTNTVTPSVTP